MWEHKPLLIVSPPLLEQGEKRGETVDVCTPGSTGTMDEVAVGEVGEKSPQKQPSHGKMKPSTTLGRRNGGMPIGFLGRIALRRKQCDAYAHC
jgi:hypothetical protein